MAVCLLLPTVQADELLKLGVIMVKTDEKTGAPLPMPDSHGSDWDLAGGGGGGAGGGGRGSGSSGGARTSAAAAAAAAEGGGSGSGGSSSAYSGAVVGQREAAGRAAGAAAVGAPRRVRARGEGDRAREGGEVLGAIFESVQDLMRRMPPDQQRAMLEQASGFHASFLCS
jgi:hypothetical protein